eukprot:COSAG04_NODE_26080_length_299_cov_1.450000_1_plen_79_part_10
MTVRICNEKRARELEGLVSLSGPQTELQSQLPLSPPHQCPPPHATLSFTRLALARDSDCSNYCFVTRTPPPPPPPPPLS